jgi:TetR/AcrR family transcriptional regulator, regulator of cefoperazone and chloramphenicol sensitivity
MEKQSTEDTSQRLLQAAGEIFAEHGFRAATVREICERASANVAAVNYHFRDKETLYGEVIRYACQRVTESYPFDPEPKGASPEARLRALVRTYLMRFFDESLAWYGKLICRELAEPTNFFERIVESDVRHYAEQLTETVREFVGHDISDEQVRMCSNSVAGQCLLYPYTRLILARLYPDDVMTADFIDRLIDHIASFSVAGLKDARKRNAGRPKVHARMSGRPRVRRGLNGSLPRS